MAKEKKSSRELASLLMAEIRKRPECANIADVAIIFPIGTNWDVAWTMIGNTMAEPVANQIAHELLLKYDAIADGDPGQ